MGILEGKVGREGIVKMEEGIVFLDMKKCLPFPLPLFIGVTQG